MTATAPHEDGRRLTRLLVNCSRTLAMCRLAGDGPQGEYLRGLVAPSTGPIVVHLYDGSDLTSDIEHSLERPPEAHRVSNATQVAAALCRVAAEASRRRQWSTAESASAMTFGWPDTAPSSLEAAMSTLSGVTGAGRSDSAADFTDVFECLGWLMVDQDTVRIYVEEARSRRVIGVDVRQSPNSHSPVLGNLVAAAINSGQLDVMAEHPGDRYCAVSYRDIAGL